MDGVCFDEAEEMILENDKLTFGQKFDLF